MRTVCLYICNIQQHICGYTFTLPWLLAAAVATVVGIITPNHHRFTESRTKAIVARLFIFHMCDHRAYIMLGLGLDLRTRDGHTTKQGTTDRARDAIAYTSHSIQVQHNSDDLFRISIVYYIFVQQFRDNVRARTLSYRLRNHVWPDQGVFLCRADIAAVSMCVRVHECMGNYSHGMHAGTFAGKLFSQRSAAFAKHVQCLCVCVVCVLCWWLCTYLEQHARAQWMAYNWSVYGPG